MTRFVLPPAKGRSLLEVFESIGASGAIFPLSSVVPKGETMGEVHGELLQNALEKELLFLPEYQLLPLEELTSLLSSSPDISIVSTELRTADGKKACFLIKGSPIVYRLSSDQYAYKGNGLEPAWKIQLPTTESKDVGLILKAHPRIKDLVREEMLAIQLPCLKEINNGQASWSLKTRLIDVKTAKPISLELDPYQIGDANIKEVKKGNLTKVDQALKWRHSKGEDKKLYDVLIEVVTYSYGIRLQALQIFIS